jgi:SAM-dependent methyltransferase
VEGHRPSTYGEAFADVYDSWYDGVSDLEGTLATIEALAGGRPVLELGVGPGRVAIPLAERGVDLTGVDASPAMLDQLRRKPGGDRVAVVEGDMAALAGVAAASHGVVFVTFNTFFNLPDEAAQRRCLTRCAQVLEPGGDLVIEAFIPSDPPATPEGRLDVRSVEVDRVLLTATWRDPHTQTVAGQHVELSESGTRLRPWLLRYATPDQLDALAADAGFSLVSRHHGWRNEPFDPEADRHVSHYRLRDPQ